MPDRINPESLAGLVPASVTGSGKESVPGLQTAKKELRAAMTARLKAVTAGERGSRSQAAASIAAGLPAWAGADLVLAFLSMPSEIDTLPVIELALKAGKRVAVPRIDDGDLAFVELTGNWRQWPVDRWNIPAPPADAPALDPAELASTACIALVPGLAFDRLGGRLGRGKGYYDRFLASVKAEAEKAGLPGRGTGLASIAFGYEFQELPEVPMGVLDFRLQGLALG